MALSSVGEEGMHMPTTETSRPLRGRAAEWPLLDAEARRKATAPAARGFDARFLAQAEHEAASGAIPPEDVPRRAAELKRDYFRRLRMRQVSQARRDAEALRALRRRLAERESANALAEADKLMTA
jgi:hypothetical protein